MDNRAKNYAKAFLKEHRLSRVTTADLRRIISEQGYTIVEFNHIFNDEAVRALIDALQLDEMVEKSKGFTYADRQRRLVFLHEDLSEQEKLLVLAHEEGHIYCNHFAVVPVLGKDVADEYEANEFAHYILNPGIAGKVKNFLHQRKKPLRIAAIILAAVALGALIFFAVKKELSYYGEYYITSSGNRYHEAQCIFVKDKTNVHRMTVEEFESGEYERCGICLPPIPTNPEGGE